VQDSIIKNSKYVQIWHIENRIFPFLNIFRKDLLILSTFVSVKFYKAKNTANLYI